MTTIMDITDVYAEKFSRHTEFVDGESPLWLSPIREAALAQFTKQGFPTVRDEEWRHTNVAPLAETEFDPADQNETRVSPEQIGQFRLGDGNEALFVFVNGRFAEHLSDMATLPAGVRVMDLSDALAANLPAVQDHFTRNAGTASNAFVALNTAFAGHGAFVEIPRGAIVETPIHLLFVSEAGDRPTAAHPRNLIVAGEGSQFRVIEHYVALDQGVYFNNVVTEVLADENVVGDHCKVIRESDGAYHIATLQVRQGPCSNISSQTICLGGAIVRNDIALVLDGEGAQCELDGLYLLTGKQHADNHLRVEHRTPHTSSREFFRGILDGRSRGVFCGRIVVQPGAQKTNAKQTNMNLLLSDQAQVDTKPQLEIFADDVKCTHGATIGQIDEDAIFYLRSRGIGEDAARSLLTYAFAGESLARVRDQRLRGQLEQLVLSRLQNGELLRGLP
ncbi:MAG: Fe-S cluster assembly protein SufD [Planctomycetota bacterium]